MKIQIAEHIRELRKKRNMMQEGLAEALGVSVAAVSKWERGAAVPELSYIVEMADLFGVSMDMLVGYQMQSGTVADLEERVHSLQKKKQYEEAAVEAEKALIRYPNDFSIVYRCGDMYAMKGIETRNFDAINRGITLLRHAVVLLSQNTDPDINEFTIQSKIAQCYLERGDKEESLSILKKYNMGGIHNELIGLTYAMGEEYKPEEAEPYLTKGLLNAVTSIIRLMSGYVIYYYRLGRYEEALETILWLNRFLESVKRKEDAVSYIDKIRAPFFAEAAQLQTLLGRQEEAEEFLKKAYKTAEKFDAAPTYRADEMKFIIYEMKEGIIYDDFGATAMQAIERLVINGELNAELCELWEKMKRENEVEK